MNIPLSPVLATEPTRVRYRVLAWFCTLSMITYIDRVCIMQVQGDMQRDLGISRTDFSWVFSAFALAYAAFEVPTGWLGDRFGPRKVLTRIVLCWLLFTSLTGFAMGLISLLVVRFLFGAGEAGAYPNMARAAKNWFPFRERGRAQGLIWTFGRWGGALAPALIIALAYPFQHYTWFGFDIPGWRGAFVLLGVLGILWVIGFSIWYRDTPREHPAANEVERQFIEEGVSGSTKPPPISWKAILSSRTLWCLSFMYFCSNAGWSFFITYVTPFLSQDLGLEGGVLLLAAGMPLFLGGVGCFVGGLFTDRMVHVLGRRWGRTLQGIVAYALGGVCFLMSYLLANDNIVLAFACICVASMVKDCAMGASWATTIDIGHRYSGTVAGLMNTVGNLATFFAAPLVAWIVYFAGGQDDADAKYAVSLIFYGCMFMVAALCWFFIDPRRVIVYAPEDEARLKAQGILK
ncbi:MAG: MFS transporter [Gemmataceae bacterium]|nr:MFS transporter [Gemmataceae bacterium]MCI0740993.1 MFS transporter [Gemmataceae bacterium]